MKAESPYFSTKTRILPFNAKCARYLRKMRIWFWKNCNFVKNRKNAHKMRIFYFGALATSEMEKAHFFLPRTGRVCRKCAFWLLKTEISKMKRGILKWVAELPVYIKSAAFGRIWCAKSIEWKWLGKSRDITIHNRITIHIGFTYKFVSALCMKKKKKLLWKNT